MGLKDKVALITGAGAGGGIGLTTAKLLADAGAQVIISGRNRERGEAAAATIEGARFIVADLTNLDDVQRLVEKAGDVDILVNNAADFAAAPTTEQTVESFDSIFATNVRGPYFLTAALAPKMAAQGSGSIINVSTMVATFGMPGMSAYGASKAAIESLTRTWAAEFGAAGVRVNAVAPGPTRSDKVVGIMGEAIEQFAQSAPLARSAATSEVAEAILFLASDRASYITGATIAVDGGRTAV